MFRTGLNPWRQVAFKQREKSIVRTVLSPFKLPEPSGTENDVVSCGEGRGLKPSVRIVAHRYWMLIKPLAHSPEHSVIILLLLRWDVHGVNSLNVARSYLFDPVESGVDGWCYFTVVFSNLASLVVGMQCLFQCRLRVEAADVVRDLF